MSEAQEFSLELEEIPIKIKDKNGTTLEYSLRELDGFERDKYLNSLSDRIRIDVNGKPSGVKNFDGLQASLLSKCLWDAEGKLVPISVVQKWPARVQSSLFEQAQKLSGLDDKSSQDQAKNG